MSSPIITVEGLGKAYFLGRQIDKNATLRDAISGFGRNMLRNLRTRTGDAGTSAEAFWALKDATFDVNRGEVVGLVGRNGAGKSTLLKLLARITEPSKGKATLRGRVASLLEVGTGLPPRADRAREHLPQRRDPRDAPHGDPAEVRRDRRVQRVREVPRHAGEALQLRHVRAAWRSPWRPTSSRRS
jgi:energy-coupling factor transporter ATP-binding protein EcfA2